MQDLIEGSFYLGYDLIFNENFHDDDSPKSLQNLKTKSLNITPRFPMEKGMVRYKLFL